MHENPLLLVWEAEKVSGVRYRKQMHQNPLSLVWEAEQHVTQMLTKMYLDP